MAHGVYVPEIIKFYGCIQVLQAMAPFNLVHPVYDMLCCSGHKYIYIAHCKRYIHLSSFMLKSTSTAGDAYVCFSVDTPLMHRKH